jgi:hypothetical protein
MFVTGILLINANGGRRFGVRNVSFNVTSRGSGGGIYDKGYYLMIKSYFSVVVVVKFTTKVEFY